MVSPYDVHFQTYCTMLHDVLTLSLQLWLACYITTFSQGLSSIFQGRLWLPHCNLVFQGFSWMMVVFPDRYGGFLKWGYPFSWDFPWRKPSIFHPARFVFFEGVEHGEEHLTVGWCVSRRNGWVAGGCWDYWQVWIFNHSLIPYVNSTSKMI